MDLTSRSPVLFASSYCLGQHHSHLGALVLYLLQVVELNRDRVPPPVCNLLQLNHVLELWFLSGAGPSPRTTTAPPRRLGRSGVLVVVHVEIVEGIAGVLLCRSGLEALDKVLECLCRALALRPRAARERTLLSSVVDAEVNDGEGHGGGTWVRRWPATRTRVSGAANTPQPRPATHVSGRPGVQRSPLVQALAGGSPPRSLHRVAQAGSELRCSAGCHAVSGPLRHRAAQAARLPVCPSAAHCPLPTMPHAAAAATRKASPPSTPCTVSLTPLRNSLLNLPASLVSVLSHQNTPAQNVVVELAPRAPAPAAHSTFAGWTGMQSKRKPTAGMAQAPRAGEDAVVEMDPAFARNAGLSEGSKARLDFAHRCSRVLKASSLGQPQAAYRPAGRPHRAHRTADGERLGDY